MGNAHHGHQYRRLVAAQRARGLPCWLCGQPIDYTLDIDQPMHFQYDHATPVSKRPDLALDPLNGRSSHAQCNKRRGNRAPAPGLGTTTASL